jgi:hypothetical protein
MNLALLYGSVLVILILVAGCSPTPRSTPTGQPQPYPAPIPTPQDAPAEPTFKPDIPPRFILDDGPVLWRPSAGKV